MTITHDTTDHRPTKAQAVTMVAGPALLLAGFAIHPSDTGGSIKMLRTISEHHGEWVAAHLLLFAAAALLVPAVLTLGRLVSGSSRRVAAVASALVVFASVGLAGAAAFEQLVGVGATLGGDSAAMVRLVEAAEKSTAVVAMLMLPQVAIVLGLLAMAWALFQSRVVPTWSAGAMAVGAVAVIAPEPLRCIGAALVLSTFVVALRRSLRHDTAAFVAGDPVIRRTTVSVG